MKDLRSIGVLLQLGWVFALFVLLPLGLGIWLDRSLHTSPYLFFVGALLGILAGTVGAVRIASRAIEDAERWCRDELGATSKEDTAE